MADPGEKIGGGQSVKSCCKFHWKGKISIMIPIITSPIWLYALMVENRAWLCMYLVVNMALFWVTEAIPLYLTSLLPVVFFPLFGILPSDKVCSYYFSDTVVMFLAGLLIALAIEYSNLHQRVALTAILLVGCSPRRLHFGLVMVTGFISLWISNSATSAMMCPIVKAILNEMETEKIFSIYKTQEEEPVEEGDPPHPSTISMAFYFGIAYAASIGGCGTLIGTGTNLTFKGLYDTRFPNSVEKVDFPIFMAYAMPFAVFVLIFLMYFSLQITHMGLFRPNSKVGQEVKKGTEGKEVVKGLIRQRLNDLGPMSCHEIQVGLVFFLMVFLLLTRKPGFCPGWANFLNAAAIGSAPPVFFCVILLFALPTQYTFFKFCCGKAPFPGQTLDACLSWLYCHKYTPFGLCFLLGGGFALAEGSQVSGMAKMLGESLSFAEKMPFALVISMCLLISLFCTSFASNVAICNILIPIFSEMAIAIKVHPLKLTFPSALACSLAFHLPVSTPPNAIISGFTGLKTKYMAAAGILPTFWAFLCLLFTGTVWTTVIYPDTSKFPKWAE
ncbi:protein I'm not dead yet 2-like [Drosophila eugracilis]|uniref:protein I'm not dead yet 2-like n=1 Tax=Drosophila eugracilis TaxID=29029 RepID=UPI001BD98E9A|nr:protein I'm not dead yet 2-like [Drosophila eugracilis]XP_041674927.1 protein I'm not dead yet 2-like [Drosophila eugracilis]